ncbi:MAG: tryptophan--tRNA ligase, partial [Nitrospira sp.]|nr:tryptophan--tRNA ligase [Nitrospira sp.]
MSERTTQRKRVLSGMQPSGLLHLGNLLGALENWKALQAQYECFFFVADWHALSTNYADTSRVKEFSRELLIDWLAAGIDPERATVFVQSHIPDHAVLHLLLSMIVPIPWLERNPTYKEKQEEIKERDLATYGFLGYPVLQAADILLYKPDFVPVGKDQLPHLELTREIARRFNSLYTPVFHDLKEHLTKFPKVLGTDGRKMSKSYGNTINLSDSEPVVRQKLKTMVTDPARVKRTDPGNPDLCPVYDFHKIYSQPPVLEQINRDCRSAAIGCIDCKKLVA